MQKLQESDYITAFEASQLEGVSYETFRKKIQRNPDEFKLRTESSENGGKERLMVSVSCLSAKARKTNKAKLQLDIENVSSDQNDQVPWYLAVDLNWYISKNKKHYYSAVELSKEIGRYLNELETIPHCEQTQFAELMAKKTGDSSRTFYRKVKAYNEAAARATQKGKETGKNYDYFKVLALARAPRETDNFPSMTPEMMALVENIRFNPLVAENQWKVKKIYRLFEEKAAENGWDKYPSYHTVDRYIKYLLETNASPAYLLKKGAKAWKGKYMDKKRRDLKSLLVLEVVMGDGHTLDCWASIKRSNGTVDYIRPHLLGWIDLRSRCLVGWVICEVPDSQTIKKSIINMMYEKKDQRLPYGVPRYIYIDNGKEFTAKCLTGRPRTERFTLDSDVKGFFRGAGIEDDIRAIPYHSFSKAEIERYFGTVCEDFSKESNSYTGTLTGSQTEAKVNRKIKEMGEKGLIESIESLAKRFQEWVTKYHSRIHEGLKDQGEDVPTPIEVFEHAERYEKPAPPYSYAESLLMVAETRMVYTTGIRMFGCVDYYHEDLRPYKNSTVQVKYDPDDVSTILVYDKEGKKICEAASEELLQISPKSTQKALTEHIKSQRRELREVKDKIEYLQMPYDQRVDLSESKRVISPETTAKNPKVVSIPEDKQFREGVKEQKSRDEYTPNEYYLKKADEYFAKLQNL